MSLPERLREYMATLAPDEAVSIARLDLSADLPPRNDFRKTVTYRHEGSCYVLGVELNAISTVLIDLNDETVVKTVSTFSEFGILEREVHWLTMLQPTGIVPRLLSHAANALTLTYCGEPVRKHNLPSDWRRQATDILAALSDHGCAHNDIKCDNLVVLDGKLSLIDFGWATRMTDPIPSIWPQGIGRQHRVDVHRFDDRKAIFEALTSAERGLVDKSIVMPR